MRAINVSGLTKRFGRVTAVNRISFYVEEGEVFGLLGPNGAGKTTTINMLATLINPTSGHAEVAGAVIGRDNYKVRKRIGIVFQDPTLDNKLTGRENLHLHAMLYGLKRGIIKERIRKVLKLIELEGKADMLVGNYSGGMKRRLEIARGLMHKPRVLFLDEPTLGLDAQTRRRIWEYIKSLKQEGMLSVILTTHYMEEADYLADRVAIIDNGKIVAIDTPANLKKSLGGDIIQLYIRGSEKSYRGLIHKINDRIKVKKTDLRLARTQTGEDELLITVEGGNDKVPLIISMAEREGVRVVSLDIHTPSLEDVFLHFTGRNIREDGADGYERNREFIKRMRR